jgi:lipoyl(octanoyl) transferase
VHDEWDNVAVDQVLTVRCGLVSYEEGVRLQKAIEKTRQADEVPDVLLLLEHYPVYTKGRRTQPGELAMGEDWYRMQGIAAARSPTTGRGSWSGIRSSRSGPTGTTSTGTSAVSRS